LRDFRLHREVDEICALLSYYTAYGGNSLLMLQNNLSVPSSSLEKYKYIKKKSMKDFFTLENWTDTMSQNFDK
jgi:hypothetical protein